MLARGRCGPQTALRRGSTGRATRVLISQGSLGIFRWLPLARGLGWATAGCMGLEGGKYSSILIDGGEAGTWICPAGHMEPVKGFKEHL